MRLVVRVILPLIVLFVPVAQSDTAVSVKTVAELAFYPQSTNPADVISRQDSILSAQLGAQVKAIYAEVGDAVERGAELVLLDCDTYQADLNTQKAKLSEIDVRLAQARDQHQRARQLNAAGNLGEERLQQRSTELKALQFSRVVQEQTLAVAQIAVDRCLVRAPFSGVILERSAQLGSLAAPGTPLIRLVQLSEPELSVRLRPEQAADLAEPLWFQSTDHIYPVRVRAIVPVIDLRERTQEVRFNFTEQVPMPGTPGRLVVQAREPHLAADLLVRRRSGDDWVLGLMLADDGQARFYPIANALEGQPFSIDLPADTLVITEGRLRVQDADPISLLSRE